MPASRTPLLLSVITLLLLAALIHSGIRPYDRPTWLMEVAPVLVVLPVADLSPLPADAAALQADFISCADPDFRRHVQLRPRTAGV